MNIFTTIWEKTKQAGRWIKSKAKQLLIWVGIIGVATASTLVVQDLTRNEISLEKISQKYEQAIEIKDKYQLDGASLKRVNIKNAELTSKGDVKDKIVVEIGDKDKTEFTPDIKISRWDEVSFKIKPNLGNVSTKDKDLKFEGDKIKFDTPDISYEMYEYFEDEGGYKFIWYLNKAPPTNKIDFVIESEGLDFFYQPELTQQEIDEGAFRPENVVGSYAVYHSTKGGMNDAYGKDYKVGKAFHIYRPHLIDANGLEVWGNLHIENGIYSVEIPQDFLDKAVYPIKSNDTFGYTTKGASFFNQLTVKYLTAGYLLPMDGTITSITQYLSQYGAENPSLYYSIYNDDSYYPNSRLAMSDSWQLTDAWDNWKELSLTSTPELTAGNFYYLTNLNVIEGGEEAYVAYADYVVTSIYGTIDTADTSPAATFPALATVNYQNRLSIYTTYTLSEPSVGEHKAYFQLSQNWTTPTGVTSVIVECWGGGGAGGPTSGIGGGGGGGGAYAKETISVSPETSYAIVIGAGGFGEGSSGGDSYFNDGSEVLAKGGVGAITSTGGSGGSYDNSIGTLKNAGGDGGNGHSTGDVSGGGGGAGGPNGAGVTASDAIANVATAGGAGDDGNGGAGGAAGAPGAGGDGEWNLTNGAGGGGGGTNASIGGYGGFTGGGGGGGESGSRWGGDGLIIITYTITGGEEEPPAERRFFIFD